MSATQIPDELLYALATCPPAAEVDWKAEYARAFRKCQELTAALDLGSEADRICICIRLAKLTNASVNIEVDVWDHRLSSGKTDIEYKIYTCWNQEFYRGASLAECESRVVADWEKHLAAINTPPAAEAATEEAPANADVL